MTLKDKLSARNIKGNATEGKPFSFTGSKDRKQPRPPRKITQKYLYNSGLYYLQRYTASTNHFRSVMMRKINKSCKHHEDQDIEQCRAYLEDVISQLIKAGHLNDEAYIKGMISSLRKRGLSKRAILSKMYAKGVTQDETAKALKQYDIETGTQHAQSEKIAAAIYCRKKRLGAFATNDKKTFEQQMGTLARAGFAYDTARSVLEMKGEVLQELIQMH